MPRSRADLVLHPVRLRLIVALARRQLTAHQLSALLPDIPQATLYHHLGLLTRAGYLQIVAERPVRGTVEKRYAFADTSSLLTPTDLANLSSDEHLRLFATFVTTLIGGFARYLEQHASDAPIDLFADRVGYREVPLYLRDDEFDAAQEALNQALLPFLRLEAAPHRRRRLFAVITFPEASEPDAPLDADLIPGDPSA
ncbi:MAG TPA: helix-turn-helix domain-containing protein [Ktedonobacterales bacterium]|nr:helix-turn-helix domain-containing protein [Ktedonobacterales bacterium]